MKENYWKVEKNKQHEAQKPKAQKEFYPNQQ